MIPLYLSRLWPNPRRREVVLDLRDCCQMHHRILQAFPDDPAIIMAREQYGVLFRVEQVEERVTVLIQSRQKPDWDRLPTDYQQRPTQIQLIEEAYANLRSGMLLRFRLRANPTKRIGKNNLEQEERWRGKRVELVNEPDQVAWLQRRGEASGFQVLATRVASAVTDIQAQALTKIHGQRTGTGKVTIGAILFEGRLRVTDLTMFQATLVNGIGHGKAYGCGLLSIARDR